MIKEYFNKDNNTSYFIGDTADIKALYKSLSRGNTNLYPFYEEFPSFNMYKSFYGLCINWDSMSFMVTSFRAAMEELFEKGLV